MSGSSKSEIVPLEPASLKPAKRTRARRSAQTPSARAQAAIRRCERAYHRMRLGGMALRTKLKIESLDEAAATVEPIAAEAYCRAMPVLADYDSARDFIACITHGVSTGIIPREQSTQLLYAAQIALQIFNCTPKA